MGEIVEIWDALKYNAGEQESIGDIDSLAQHMEERYSTNGG